MSDNVVKAGVEDVLSSVKRLVSEEVREDSEFIFVPTAPDRKPGRLVLTESLRVSEQETPKPFKLVPEFGAKKVATEAREPANKPAPMRLQPSHIVKPATEGAKVALPEADRSVAKNEKRDLAGSLSAKIEALEAAIARTEDQWEPDGESDDAYSGTPTKAVNWPEDAADRATDADTEAPAVFTRNIDTAEPAKPALNEEVLTELVAKVVREELQGALGEGITRNIRKMVRREINKALAAQDLK